MKLEINKLILAIGVLPFLAIASAQAQVEVNFVDSGQTVPEKGTLTVGIELSEPSLLDVSVPYVIASGSTAVLGADFEIAEDEIENDEIVFDNESPIIFKPGETQKIITVTIINDDIVEGDELLTFELVADGLTIGKLGEHTQHTIRIVDNDPVLAHFKTHKNDYYENENITVSVYLSDAAEQDVIVNFGVTLLTADNNDVDLEDSFTSNSPLTISAGSSVGTISIKVNNDSITDRNEGGLDEETLQIQLNSATLEDGTPINTDAEPFVATIVDNDPITVGFNYADDLEFPLDLNEYNTTSLRVTLVGPDGVVTTADDDIEIPISFGGSATLGSGDNDDYNPSTDPLVISAGSNNQTVSLLINNDDNVEEDELLTATLGSPAYKDGGDVVLGEKSEMSFLLIDNDPVTLSFQALYSKDDAQAFKDADYENILYVDSAGSTISEHLEAAYIPIRISSPSGNNAEFKLELLSEGTTATIYDPSGDTDQDWDFYVSSHALAKVGDVADMVMAAGSQLITLQLVINNDDETPVVYGQEASEDVEADETVRFRLTEINTDSSHVSPGGSMEYTLTIRDLPDIDITDVMTGLSPNPAFLENGGLHFNDMTGLFEAHYLIEPATTFDVSNLAGYRSMKFLYRTSNYDASNPDSDENDPLIQSPDDPDEGVEFHYFVNSPFQVRYPFASEQIILKEGVDAVDNVYDVTTADTIETAPYILRPLYFPPMNDFEAEIEGAYDINDTLDWIVNFYSGGYFFFPSDRIDPATNPDRLRVYLTAEGTNVFAASGTAANISTFTPMPDGSVYMVIESGNNARSVQIQYLDPGDEWRVAHPEYMSNGGASKFYWIDQGPPQTQTHPKNVPFRLYRAIRN